MANIEPKIQETHPTADHNSKRLVIANLSALYDEQEFHQKLK